MSNEGNNPIRLYESQERFLLPLNVAKRSYIFKNKDESVLTIEERFGVQLQLPALQWIPSVNENVTKRNYTFKNKDETVLTIEERFRVQLQLPALQRMPSANENVAKRRYTFKKRWNCTYDWRAFSTIATFGFSVTCFLRKEMQVKTNLSVFES